MKFKYIIRSIGVSIIAVTITALTIDATDSLTGKDGSLLSSLSNSLPKKECSEGMIPFESATAKCVDQFEVAPSPSCPQKNPANNLDTRANLDTKNCIATSQENKIPWRFITRDQALLACQKSGKRLPTNTEWYQAALGTPDMEKQTPCNLSFGTLLSSLKNECVSASGAYHMVGNVWEWVHDDVSNGEYNGRTLPKEGHVAQVDSSGVAVLTEPSKNELFNADYLWSNSQGVYAMMRGGFYGSGSDGGVYTLHADTLPTTAGTAIGFRCVQ